MAKSDRLFRLMHLMRLIPPPATAARLAEELDVSERTIYRDVEALRVAGARIEGAAGLGYTLAEDVALPPQTLSRLEIEALVLGLGEVQHRGDPELASAARDALAKIGATLPEEKQRQISHAIGMVYRFHEPAETAVEVALIRNACWDERALDITYRDRKGAVTERRIYPLAIVYLDMQVLLLAWCRLRRGFRQFIVPSILAAAKADESFRPRRVMLLRDYVTEMRGLYRSCPDR